jgi:tetratricopeptide (TPR) repeat protein
MNLAPLFRKIVIGAAESSLDVAGSALLPVGWPILKGALQPVLARLKQRFNGEDVTGTKTLAEAAATAFEQDQHLQELLRSNLLEALRPVVEGQQELAEDVKLLMLVALGNTRAIEEIVGGLRRLEDVIAAGVSLRPDAEEKLARAVAQQVAAIEQTRTMARQEIHGMAGDLIERQAARIEARAVELIREGKLDRAVDELREGLVLVATLVSEAPSDAGLRVLLGYFYKAIAQAFQALGDKEQEHLYLDRAGEIFALVKDHVPPDQKSASDICSAVNGLGNVYAGRGEFEKALENYRLATILCPDYAYAWHDMFGAYDALARSGRLELEPMRHALQKVRETGQGIPGLGGHSLETPAHIGIAPELGADNDTVLAEIATPRRRSRTLETRDHLTGRARALWRREAMFVTLDAFKARQSHPPRPGFGNVA